MVLLFVIVIYIIDTYTYILLLLLLLLRIGLRNSSGSGSVSVSGGRNIRSISVAPRNRLSLKSTSDSAIDNTSSGSSIGSGGVGRSTSNIAPPSSSGGGSGGKLCCDKCDGKHETNACPHFKKDRENHPGKRMMIMI